MKIFIENEQKHDEFSFSGKVLDLLAKLSINPETVIVSKNNELVTEDDTLADTDEVKILNVISGG